MTIEVGQRLPEVTFRMMTSEGPKPRTTQEFFGGRKVVLIGLPGAFTPTCHNSHLPGYVANAAQIKAKGVDAIAVTAINDHFVMDAWSKTFGPTEVEFLADGNGEFASAIGVVNDRTSAGMGLRSKRYSMLVEDCVVKSLNLDEVPGKVDFSSAEHMLSTL